MESNEYTGIWWIIDKEERKIPGALKISPNGKAILELYGSFTESLMFNDSNEKTIIVGITNNGKKITLYNCELSGENISLYNEINFQSYSPFFSFIGVHIKNVDDFTFNGLSLSLTYLSDWFKDTGFTHRRNFNDDELISYNINYSYPKEIKIILDEFQLNIFRSLKTKGSFKKGLNLKEEIHFSLDFNEAKDIESIFSLYVRPLQNLITFCINKASTVKELYFYSEKFLMETKKEKKQIPIEVLFTKSFWDDEPETDLVRSTIFVKAQDIKQGYDTFFRKWFKLSKEIRDVLMFLFAPLYNKQMYFQNEYFTIIQAVEGFHRNIKMDTGKDFFNQKDLDDASYEKKKKIIKELIPKNDQEWFFKKICYNEPSLKERIIDIYKNITDKHHDLSFLKIEKLAKRAADFRNMLAHPQNDRTIQSNDFAAAAYIQEALTSLVYLTIYIELGFNYEFIAKKIADNNFNFFLKEVNNYL